MEFWPSDSQSAKRDTSSKQRKGKERARATEDWANYPVINHGALSAATLVRNSNKLEWKTVYSSKKGLIRTSGEPLKLYPCTRPEDVRTDKLPLQQTTEQGARFLRTYHPDIEIPFELIKDELRNAGKAARQLDVFDPFQGNTLAATYCLEAQRTRSIAVAFPTGITSNELNVSAINLRARGLLFQPKAKALWSFNTPIRQILSSSPTPLSEFKKGYYLAVRTYGQVHLFDLRHQSTSDRSKSPYALSQLLTLGTNNFDDDAVMDMALPPAPPVNLYLVTKRGFGYHCSLREDRHVLQRMRDKPYTDDSDFWRICADESSYGGIVASSKSVWKFDTRTSGSSPLLLEYSDDRHAITSVCPSQVDHLYSVCTTNQVIWIDVRYPKQPLLGWMHRRAFDRSLTAQNMDLDGSSLCLLSSRRTNHISSIAMDKILSGPLQCQMPTSAVPSALRGLTAAGRALVRHPYDKSPTSFALLELSRQNSLHCQELAYFKDGSTVEAQAEEIVPQFSCYWSEGVKELERQAKLLRPDLGKAANREFAVADFSELYEDAFGERASEKRERQEEENAESVYETLESMPDYWQRSELDNDFMHTLFDVAFASGSPPLFETRATFLTGSVLDSARGFRARNHGRIPAAQVARSAAWHYDLRPTLDQISPDAFVSDATDARPETGASLRAIEPYRVNREDELPAADRREAEARERLALDLELAADVYSGVTFRRGVIAEDAPEEDERNLTEAAERLSLQPGQSDARTRSPPRIKFGFLRPVVRNPGRHYRTDMSEARPSRSASKSRSQSRSHPRIPDASRPKSQSRAGKDADDTEDNGDNGAADAEEPELPPGVRLLLSEWTIGTDPLAYTYVDPYDLDHSTPSGVQQQPAIGTARGRRKNAIEGVNFLAPVLAPAPPIYAPPTIVAARSLASQPPAVGATRAFPQTQTQHGSQPLAQSTMTSSQPAMVPQTQVLPGPFGGRPSAAKKKPKKRVGGF